MISELIKKLVYCEKANNKTFVTFLKKRGVSVGENVKFFDPIHTFVDISSPHLLTIGDDVMITRGVVILTHDYSWSVLKKYTGDVVGAQSAVKIGNNVFIGMNAVITRGVTIGDNVIVGAGSIVTKDCESDGVYVGNPARRIMSLREFYAKRKDAQIREASDVVKKYHKRHGTVPPKETMREYFMLFTNVDEAISNPVFDAVLSLGQNYDKSVDFLSKNPPHFKSYEEFTEYALKS